MLAGVIIKMVEDAFRHRCFIIDAIISNNNIKMQDVIKYSSRGAWVKVPKSSKGNLDDETPVLSFLSDPYYQVKVVSKHVFAIGNYRKVQRYGCTKADALKLKNYCGYTIKNNRNKILDK